LDGLLEEQGVGGPAIGSTKAWKVVLSTRQSVCLFACPSKPPAALRCAATKQGMLLAEMWLERVAREVRRPVEAVRQLNMYREGDRTHFGQTLDGNQAPACWRTVRAALP
jgi:CO/xanthine dehydrogenase Mo-binding subunit